MDVYLVYGPPCSGKTTWVLNRATEFDLIIDLDRISSSLSICNPYKKGSNLIELSNGIKQYLIKLVSERFVDFGTAYVIGLYPFRSSRQKLRKELKAKIKFIYEPKEVCLERSRVCRPKGYDQVIDKWFETYEPDIYDQDADVESFYKSKEWRKVRSEVLRMDHYECQLCKERGIYKKATCVHHVKHLRDRPDLALELFDGEERQLISLCDSCHDIVHPEKFKDSSYIKPITDERW